MYLMSEAPNGCYIIAIASVYCNYMSDITANIDSCLRSIINSGFIYWPTNAKKDILIQYCYSIDTIMIVCTQMSCSFHSQGLKCILVKK